jgi:hypothetical protein
VQYGRILGTATTTTTTSVVPEGNNDPLPLRSLDATAKNPNDTNNVVIASSSSESSHDEAAVEAAAANTEQTSVKESSPLAEEVVATAAVAVKTQQHLNPEMQLTNKDVFTNPRTSDTSGTKCMIGHILVVSITGFATLTVYLMVRERSIFYILYHAYWH